MFLLLLLLSTSVSAASFGCKNTPSLIDSYLGLTIDYNTLETVVNEDMDPLVTFSCEPANWSSDQREATLFTCSEKDNICIDAALVCNGVLDCPNGADEEEGGLDCTKYGCPYPQLGGYKCNSAWVKETKLCIHRGWICDGYEDCVDASDEQECDKTGWMMKTVNQTNFIK